MNIELQTAPAGWKNLTAADLASALPSSIEIGDIPALPLARAADMPSQAGFARGSLSLNLSALKLSLQGETPLSLEQVSTVDGRSVVALRVQGLMLNGVQALQGTQIWESDLDGAGTGLPFDAKRQGGTGAADTDKHPLWTATANEHRATLNSTSNGQTLLSTYSTHRAAFNDVFTQPIARGFQRTWNTPAILQMAQHTHEAVNGLNDVVEVINSSSKIYGDTTYNGNAQNQQLSLVTTLLQMAQAANPENPKDPTNPYNQAAASTLTFAVNVTSNTNVTLIKDVPELKTSSVYDIVKQGTPAPPLSVDDVHAFINGSAIGGRDAQGNTWTMVLSEDERAFVRKLQAEQAEHMARLAATKPVTLAQGSLRAALECFVYLQFVQEQEGLRLLDGRVELDGFDLDFDDSHWDQQLGSSLAEETRSSLAQARFIKSLLHDRVADALERELVEPLAQALLGAQ